MSELYDTHIHLDFEQYVGEEEAILTRAREAGVTKLITIGAGGGIESTRDAIEIAERFPNVWASVGVHPQNAGQEISFDEIIDLASRPKVVAIGETGLDFYRDWSPQEAQRDWFKKQIILAKEIKKPLIIHSRDAADECLETLKSLGAKEVRGVFHCYSEDASFAKKLREIDFLVSFTGNITFKKAESVREAAKHIPLDQIMVETDGPFMAPEPHRGKRSESMHVVEIAKVIASVKGIPYEEVCKQTCENAECLFKFPSF